jgi:threonine dehydratase
MAFSILGMAEPILEKRTIMNFDDKPTGWGGAPVSPPDLNEIQAASERLKHVVVRTPLLPLQSFDEATDIFLKPEILQPIGSYKLRGVYNWAASLTTEERNLGLSTVSAGNTAMALGYTARLFGVPARSLLPDSVPTSKLEAIKRYRVEAVLLPMSELINFIFEARWDEEPYSFLNPWADQKMIAGSGSIGLEIFHDMPEVETVFVPVGGGGLISGIGSALKVLKRSLRVVGVQSEACPSLQATFNAGRPTWVDAQSTICDGTAVPFVVDEMYPLLRQVVDETVLVSEEAVRIAIKRLALRNKLIVEGSGALSVAAALATPHEERGKTVCIISGGSIDSDKLMEIIALSN